MVYEGLKLCLGLDARHKYRYGGESKGIMASFIPLPHPPSANTVDTGSSTGIEQGMRGVWGGCGPKYWQGEPNAKENHTRLAGYLYLLTFLVTIRPTSP